MNIITNLSKHNNHASTIIECLNWCDKAYFSVAFLKSSGLSILMDTIRKRLASGIYISIVAGQNFGLTEPDALYKLYKETKNFSRLKLYLAKALDNNSIFHPKLYLFKKNNECRIISGSANLTKGGLETNKEISFLFTISKNTELWKNSFTTFKYFINQDNSDELTFLIIKTYEGYFTKQKQHNKNSNAIPQKAQTPFDEKLLSRYLAFFKNQDFQRIFNERIENYVEAKNVLDEIADTQNLTKRVFAPLLDRLVSEGLWHSGSINRHKNSVINFPGQFSHLVQFIRANIKNHPNVVFDEAKKLVKPIRGASINYITEIMSTYNYKDFAILNKNPINALTIGASVCIKKTPDSYNGSDYLDFCLLIKDISSKFGFKNMLEADSFFNHIYWEIKNSNKI